jgi:hypothetical protein
VSRSASYCIPPSCLLRLRTRLPSPAPTAPARQVRWAVSAATQTRYHCIVTYPSSLKAPRLDSDADLRQASKGSAGQSDGNCGPCRDRKVGTRETRGRQQIPPIVSAPLGCFSGSCPANRSRRYIGELMQTSKITSAGAAKTKGKGKNRVIK